jgi:predicted acyl esterase
MTAVAIACCVAFCLSVVGRVNDVAAQGDDTYDVLAQRDVMVRMRDGVRLATTLYLPARNG